MAYDLKALDAALEKRIKEKKLPGVSVTIRGPEGVIFAKGYGYGDKDEKLPIDENTIFGIASMSKSTTALCLAILEAEGKFSFSDPVTKYIPSFRVPGNPTQDVTVRHLAMHTAGIPPMEPLEWSIALNTPTRDDSEWLRTMKRESPNKMDTIDDVINYIAEGRYKTLGQAGEYMSYSNEGYAVLSYIVDAAAGIPLEQFLKERVFGPMGMTRSVLDLDGSEARELLPKGNMTRLFERDEHGNFSVDDAWSILPPFRGCACVKSTAHDMARYYQCLSNGGVLDGVQVLPKGTAEIMIGASFPELEEPTYCYGLNKRTHLGHVFCEHAGGLHGVSTFGGLIKGENYGFAALCNEGDQDTDDLTWMMYNMIIGRPLEEDHRWLHPASEPFMDADMIVGEYEDHEGMAFTVKIEANDGKLVATTSGGVSDMIYCGSTWFMLKRNGEVVGRMHFYIRDGKAWAVKVGTRIHARKGN